MDCDQVTELLAAYALSALGAEETEAARRHLAGCRNHDAELGAYREIVPRLPLSAGDMEPPSDARARLLAAFDVEAGGPVAEPVPVRTRRPALPQPLFAYLAAAALLLAVIGLSVWNLTLQLGGGSEQILSVTLDGAAGAGDLVYSRDDKIGVLTLDLPPLPAGRVYQAWRIEAAGPVSLGLVSGGGVVGFQADLSQSNAVAVSEEPAGGSVQPTTSPLLVAELR